MKLSGKDPILRTINSKLTKTEKKINICYQLYGMHAVFLFTWAFFVLIPFIQTLPNNASPYQLIQYPLLVALIFGLPITIALLSWEDRLKKQWKSEQQSPNEVKQE